MSSNWELQLISKILEEKDLDTAERVFQLDGSCFISDEAGILFRELSTYARDRRHYGDVPPLSWLMERYPTVRLPRPEASLRELCVYVRSDFTRRKLMTLSDDLMDIAIRADDPQEAVDFLMRESKAMTRLMLPGEDMDFGSSAFDAIRQEVEQLETSLGLIGHPFPWEVLNKATQGLENGCLYFLYARPKCVVRGERVMGRDGGLRPIELAASMGAPTLVGQRLEHNPCTGSYAGVKKAVRVTTSSGHTVGVGEDHPMIRPDLWFTPAGQLMPGDYVGVVGKLPQPPAPVNALTAADAEILGYLTGDGNYTRNEVQFTNKDPGAVQRLQQLLNNRGLLLCQRPSAKEIEYSIVSAAGVKGGNPLLQQLRDLGMLGATGPEKKVPQALFQCDNERIAAFLSGYTDTDGCISVKGKKVYWATSSLQMARDVKHLLLRFGVTAVLQQVRTNYGTDAWYVNVYAQEQHRVLAQVLHLHVAQKKQALHVLACKQLHRKRQDDGIPETAELRQAIMQAKGTQRWGLWKTFSADKLFRRSGMISRSLLRQLAAKLNAPQLLGWANSDIRWEKVVSVEQLGDQECYDLTVEEGEPVFVVEDFVTHNSMKTWVMLHIAANLYVNYGLRVLIWCREMRPSQMRRRLAMLIGGIDYQAFRCGNLTDEEKQRLFDNLEMLKEEEHAGKKQRLFITKGSHTTSEGSETSMMELRAKAEDLEPQIIFADSPYHMQASTKWQDIGSLARNLKELAVDLNVPVFCTWQANRSGEKTNGRTMDEIALGDALGQEADGLFRLLLRGTKEHPLLSLVVPGAREFSFDGFTMHGRPAYDFSFYSDKVLWEQEDKAPDSIRAPRRDRTVVKQQALTGMKEIDYGDG